MASSSVVQQNGVVGDKGIEADNNVNGENNTPRSKPTIYNLTLVGSNLGGAGKVGQGGIHLRRGTAGHVYNAIVTGFTSRVVDVDGANTVSQFDGGELFLKNSIVYGNAGITDGTTAWPETDNDGGFDERAELFDPSLANTAIDPQLATSLTDLASPSFLPVEGSPALTGGATPPADGFFDTAATYRGAFGTTDWTAGWTAFPAN